MGVDVILPAGGRITGEFAAEAGAEVKALIPLGGQTVLERMLATLGEAGCVERTVVIGPEEIAAHPAARAADTVLPEADSGPANLFRGLEWLHHSNGGRHAGRVLIAATDLPFLTPGGIAAFLDSCPPDADIVLPLVRRQAVEARFPGLGGEYVRLRDGEWTMGCAFLVNPAALVRSRPHVERVFEARKSQFAMARLLGPLFLARLLIRQLTVAHVEQRCMAILGCTGVGLRDCAPELSFDIDRVEEFRYALRHVGGTVGAEP